MTTEQAAPAAAQGQAEAFTPPTYVQEELARLQGQRERLENRLRGLRTQEADLAGQVSPNDALAPGVGRVRLAGPGAPEDLQICRADISWLEAELESVDRRMGTLHVYIARLREQAAASVPPPLTARAQLEFDLQQAIFDAAATGKGQRRVEELERQIEDLDKQERRARLLQAERARREAEAERERQEQERAVLQSERDRVQAELTAAQRAYQDLLDQLIERGREITQLDDRCYDLGYRLHRTGVLGQMGAGRRRLETYTTARFTRAGLFKDAPPIHPADLEPLVPPAP